jgi:hypothetical protein
MGPPQEAALFASSVELAPLSSQPQQQTEDPLELRSQRDTQRHMVL